MTHYRLTPINADCPVCYSQKGHLLYSVAAEQATQHYFLQQVNPARFAKLRSHIEALWKHPDGDVVRCASCGFGFSSPYVAGDAQFYRLAYSGKGYPAWRWEYQAT